MPDDPPAREERLIALADRRPNEPTWIEFVVALLPTPVFLCEPGSGTATFANPAADRLAGGHFPLGHERNSDDGEFFLSDPATGERIPRERAPSMRAALSGEPVENVQVDWHTPSGVRSIVASADTLPPVGDQPATVVVCFEDVTELRQEQRRSGDAVALLDTLFDRAPVGLAYFDRDLRFVRVNDALAEMNGMPARDHVGRHVDELLPDMDPAVVAALRKVLETGEPLLEAEVHGATPAQPGERRTWLSGFYPVRGSEGEIIGLGAVVVEITARKRAEAERERSLARAQFLAEASVALDRSLDYYETLRNVAQQAVPGIADWCAVDVAAHGALQNVAVTHADPAKIGLAERLMNDFYYRRDAPNGPPAVMRTGRPELLPEIDDELLRVNARGTEHFELLREFGMRSLMVVPMITRGHLLGTITLVSAESGRRFDTGDLALAEDLARRAALAVDNARLYSERAHIARTLQESLLPPRLPDIEGVDGAARYVAAGAGIDVGGDFYDLFDAGRGDWSIVMGDVCGKGADAAALTALARYTLRATAPRETRPSRVLEQLNEAVLRQRGDGRFITVAYASLVPDADGAQLTLCIAGHPPPILLRADGTAMPIGAAGTLLGVVEDPDLTDVTLRLGAGDALFLYTDGVTEARAPEQLLEPPDVARILERCGGGDAAALVGCVEAAIRDPDGRPPADDIAMLALRMVAR